MKTLYILLPLLLLAACGGGGKQPQGYEAKRDSMLAKTRHPRIERMRDYHYTAKVECRWADSYSISRVPSDSLGTVTDDEGTRHVNNRMQLALTSGATVVFRHTFTKDDFASMGDSRFFRRAVLQGMAFDCVEGGNVRFVASVGLPDSDEFVQFAITVGDNGEYIIEPTEIMDEALVEQTD